MSVPVPPPARPLLDVFPLVPPNWSCVSGEGFRGGLFRYGGTASLTELVPVQYGVTTFLIRASNFTHESLRSPEPVIQLLAEIKAEMPIMRIPVSDRTSEICTHRCFAQFRRDMLASCWLSISSS